MSNPIKNIIKKYNLLSYCLLTLSISIAKFVYADDIPIYPICAPTNRLVTVNTSYYDFNGVTHQGTIQVLDTIAPAIQRIFEQLYIMKYPINLMDANLTLQSDPFLYHTVNEADKDNTASYSCRAITGGTAPSLHAYGAAIDLNPRENPYIGINPESGEVTGILPADGWININRMKYRYGKPIPAGRSEEVVDIFAENGILYWGGYWNFPIDYMHFELDRENANLLLTMTTADANSYFKMYTDFYNSCKVQFPEEYAKRQFIDLTRAIDITYNESAVGIYKQSPQNFFKDAGNINISAVNCVNNNPVATESSMGD